MTQVDSYPEAGDHAQRALDDSMWDARRPRTELSRGSPTRPGVRFVSDRDRATQTVVCNENSCWQAGHRTMIVGAIQSVVGTSTSTSDPQRGHGTFARRPLTDSPRDEPTPSQIEP
jgi:hypothetical protein